MEIIVRIQDQLPLQEREYTRDGMQEKFATLPFLLQHGDCTFYAEMIQEQARKTGTLSRDFYYVATLQAQARPWTDQQGAQRYENRLTLIKLCVL